MKLAEAVQVAAFLGVSQEDVLRYAGANVDAPSRGEPARRGRPPRPLGSSPPPLRAEPIPIRGAARSSPDHEMVLAEGPIGYTPRPSNLNGVRGAYAIYMVGDSMEPRYRQGWLLHVNPFKPSTHGRDVVVFKAGQAVLIKQFVRWDSDALVLYQLNPPEELRVPRDEVLECHLVVGVDQEG